jgi:hypothetical protein
MEPRTPISQSYSIEQFQIDRVALRRELGLPGGRMTEEQQKIYLEATTKLWREKTNWQPSTPPYGSREPATVSPVTEPQS